jgi:hypothetical protein
MKHVIYPEKQGTPTAISADTNYPVTNLTANNYRKKVWKAVSGVQIATLRIPISANAEVISLHNTNAETVICTITLDSAEQTLNNAVAVDKGGGLVGIPLTGHGYSEANILLLNGSTNYDGVHILPSQTSGSANEIIITATYQAETFAGTETVCIIIESTIHTLETTTRTYDRFWQEYTEQVAAHTATIKLTAASGETIEAGIVRAGSMQTYKSPQYGISQSPRDFSIKKQLRNGAIYTKKLEIIRAYSYSLNLVRDTEFNDLIDLYNYYGPDPFCMLITDAIDDNYWCLFGSFDSEPQGSHSYPNDSIVNITILEAV